MHPFFKWIGFPIRKSADQFIFADPHGLSQLITSFIASESQGIPRVPFLTFFYLCRLLLGKVCLYFESHWSFRLATSEPNNVPTVVFSSIYFFQYVKERFATGSLLNQQAAWRITDSNR